MRKLKLFYQLSNKLVVLLSDQAVITVEGSEDDQEQNRLETLETIDELYGIVGKPTEDDEIYQLSVNLFGEPMNTVHVSQALTEWVFKHPVQSESGKLLIDEYYNILTRLKEIQSQKPSPQDEALARRWGMSIQEIERIF
jgi:hypothetical protein